MTIPSTCFLQIIPENKIPRTKPEMKTEMSVRSAGLYSRQWLAESFAGSDTISIRTAVADKVCVVEMRSSPFREFFVVIPTPGTAR